MSSFYCLLVFKKRNIDHQDILFATFSTTWLSTQWRYREQYSPSRIVKGWRWNTGGEGFCECAAHWIVYLHIHYSIDFGSALIVLWPALLKDFFFNVWEIIPLHKKEKKVLQSKCGFAFERQPHACKSQEYWWRWGSQRCTEGWVDFGFVCYTPKYAVLTQAFMFFTCLKKKKGTSREMGMFCAAAPGWAAQHKQTCRRRSETLLWDKPWEQYQGDKSDQNKCLDQKASLNDQVDQCVFCCRHRMDSYSVKW